jgi:hypothetical protein
MCCRHNNRADAVGINMVDLNTVPNESMIVDADIVPSIDGRSNKRLLYSLFNSSIVALLVFVRLKSEMCSTVVD